MGKYNLQQANHNQFYFAEMGIQLMVFLPLLKGFMKRQQEWKICLLNLQQCSNKKVEGQKEHVIFHGHLV